ADEDERSDPVREEAGKQHRPEHRPAEPGGLDDHDRADGRRPEDRRDGEKLRAAVISAHRVLRGVLLDQALCERAEPIPSALSDASSRSLATLAATTTTDVGRTDLDLAGSSGCV